MNEQYRWVDTIHRENHLVHLMADDQLSRSVIVKRPLSKADTEFYNWCQETVSLKHQHLAECWLDENALVMPYYTYSIKTRIEQKRFLTENEVVVICSQILDALAYLHRRGWWCVDIKPEHIFLDTNGQARLIDFTDHKKTLAYTAPEALLNQPGDARSDMWSLGVSMVEMLGGSLPFRAKTTFGMTWTIQNDEPILPDTISEAMWEFLNKALQKDPDQRWSYAAEMKKDLKNLNKNDELS